MVTPVTVANAANSIAQGLSNTVAGVQSTLNRLGGGSFWEQLRPASYRGVPFVTVGGSLKVGRRNAVHEYPLRDVVWVEDLGRMPRRLMVQGFLVGDDVIAQRERLIAACETPGGGQLVHPTLGRLTLSVLDVDIAEHRERGRVFEFNFTFIEAGKRIFPQAQTDTKGFVALAANTAALAAAADFVSAAVTALQSGAAVVQSAVATATTWTSATLGFARDAASLINLVVTLPGSFGRQVQTLTSGFTAFQQSAANTGATVQSLEGTASVARATLQTAAVNLQSGAADLSSATAAAYPALATAYCAAVQQTASTPRAALQALQAMATPVSLAAAPTGAVGTAIGTMQTAQQALFSRTAAIALATAASNYAPFSADDASAVRAQVTGVLDDTITGAGDAGDDQSYVALIALRAAVVQNLNARGAALPAVVPIVSAGPLPALALAQRLYRDPSRADELVAEADPPHPAFMPTRFLGLAA